MWEFELYNAFYRILVLLYPYILSLIVASLGLTVGIMLAKCVQYAVVYLLTSIPMDETIKSLKLAAVLEKAEIKRPFSELLGDFSYWLVIFIMIAAVARFLGLPVDPLIVRVFNYVGIVFLAALVLSLGVFLSSMIAGIIYVVAVNVGLPGAKTIARLMQYATIIFAFLVALEQLGIGPVLIVPSIGVIIGAVGLALAIAFGLGCKDIMADFISNLIRGK